jgi:hypothetical protein
MRKIHIDLHPSVDPSGYNDMYFLVPLFHGADGTHDAGCVGWKTRQGVECFKYRLRSAEKIVGFCV